MKPILHAVVLLLLVVLGPVARATAADRPAQPDDSLREGGWRHQATRPNWWRQTRTYRTKYHPWTPPDTKQAWETEAEKLRTQLLVSQGLWPLPEKTPLEPVIHGRIDAEDYTIEKVYFASRPGLYVTGNLYRPKPAASAAATPAEKRPAILSPHGHWANGRFYLADEKTALADLRSGAETFSAAAHSPIQARMVQLARMGFVVFHYDMIGYADNTFLDHRADFVTPADGMWLLESMGLQTWNSLRALDFLCSLPDVDAERIGMTGASGGGTQTFILGAIDERIRVAFPAVMVSTDMQGGCVCENAPYLRLDTNNVAIAALFAPRPLGLTGANDWTLRIASRGLPELRHIYRLFGQPEHVDAWVHPEFGHNFNAVSRRHANAWLKTHLNLPETPLEERDFELKTPQELTVFDAAHPRPADAANGVEIRSDWIEFCADRLAVWAAAPPEQVDPILKAAAEVLLGGTAPVASQVTVALASGAANEDSAMPQRMLATRVDSGLIVPVQVWRPAVPTGKGVFVFSEMGVDPHELTSAARQALLEAGTTIVTADIRGTGQNRPAEEAAWSSVDKTYYGYTFGYEPPPLAQQVQDILTVVTGLSASLPLQQIELVGHAGVGMATMLAQPMLNGPVEKLTVDLERRGFSAVMSVDDRLFLPGALMYGGCGGLTAYRPCAETVIHGVDDSLKQELALLLTRPVQVTLSVNPLVRDR